MAWATVVATAAGIIRIAIVVIVAPITAGVRAVFVAIASVVAI
jgi:hypothetical protein